MKGIILAGGKGTRLLPCTSYLNKHMVPILNRPMILYPLETLKTFGIEDILIVSGGNHIGAFADFLGDGSAYGVNLTYRVQKEAGGIAQALGLAKGFAYLGGERVAVILGDNIFDNTQLPRSESADEPWDAHLFIKAVEHPERFGVLYREIVDNTERLWIEEKPKVSLFRSAVTGLYIYPDEVFDLIPALKPSARGELEITDINNYYLTNKRCVITELSSFWSDAGTPESLKDVINWAYGQ